MDRVYGQIAEGNSVNSAIYQCFEYITEADRRKFVKKFREQPHDKLQVMHTFRELILGAYLGRAGFPSRIDTPIEGKTPDWAVMEPDLKGVVELVNFQTDQKTAEEIRTSLAHRSVWCGWVPSNVPRLYDRIHSKAVVYKTICQRLGFPYVVAVFGSFEACVSDDEIEECLNGKDGLFALYPHLSGLLTSQENGGSYFFQYVPNPHAERPWKLPSCVFDLSS